MKQICILTVEIWAASWQNQQSGSAPSKDSDVFAVHLLGS